MKRITGIMMSLAVMLVVNTASAAGIFSLHYQVLTSSQANNSEQGRLLMDVANGGAGAVLNVTAEIVAPEGAHFGKGVLLIGSLAPAEIKVLEADVSFPPALPIAVNPIVVRIEYEDSNGARHSTLVDGVLPPMTDQGAVQP